MGAIQIILSILVYGIGFYFLIHGFLVESNPDYHRLAGVMITLVLFTCKMWKSRKFVREKSERFEIEYNDIIRDTFQYNENDYTYFMQGIDYVILNKPQKAMPIFKELQEKASTINEMYAVNFFIAECYDVMKQYENEIAICHDMIRMDAERVDAWFHMGTSYIMLDKYREAIEALEHAAAIVAGGNMAADVYVSLASAYVGAEDFIPAKRYIDMAYQLNQHKDISSMKDLIEGALESPIETVDGVEVTPLFKHMVETIGYPCKVFTRDTMEEEPVDIYRKAVQRGKAEGFVPIFVADYTLSLWMDELENIGDMSYKEYVKARIDHMGQLEDGKEIANKKLEELTQPNPEYEVYDLGELTGDLSGGGKQDDFGLAITYDLKVCLFEVPVNNPWEVLLYVPGVLWEEYAVLDEVIAICKYWYEKYSALPAFVSFEGIDFVLPEPVPESEAFEVAKEIFAFCEDRVTQDTESGTLGELADSIRKSTVWSLWWD